MTPDRIAEAHAVTVALESRIHELAVHRNWYVVNRWARGPEWDEMRRDDRLELRALIRLAHKGKRLAREAVERTDAVSIAKAYADWTSGELVAGFGR
jgi:hypothetical protein